MVKSNPQSHISFNNEYMLQCVYIRTNVHMCVCVLNFENFQMPRSVCLVTHRTIAMHFKETITVVIGVKSVIRTT